MDTMMSWKEAPSPCDYRPDHHCQREYIHVAAVDPDEYAALLVAGWRRFGHTLFRLRCIGRDACRQLRIDCRRFRPARNQRRCRKANEGTLRLRIGTPSATPEKVALLDRFHTHRSATRSWPIHGPDDVDGYSESFVENPLPTQEWCYFLDDVLVGVGYVDRLDVGLSAIYFAHDPAHHDRSLGTWNILCLIDRARALDLPHVYLGHFGTRCPSLEYKARFQPHEVLGDDGSWRTGAPGKDR